MSGPGGSGGPRHDAARGAWDELLDGESWLRHPGGFPLPAYSEFMPPPWVGRKPIGTLDPAVHDPRDGDGFLVDEYQQAHELRPGLDELGARLGDRVRRLVRGEHVLSAATLSGNAYWPFGGAAGPGRGAALPAFPPGARDPGGIAIVSIALSRTQDDKGRVRWTLLGSSDEGPARAFWRSFGEGPGERPEAWQRGVLSRLLSRGFGLDPATTLESAGFRILPAGDDAEFPRWGDEEVPRWAKKFVLSDEASLDSIRHLLTFRPFTRLPAGMQRAFLDGKLRLLPHPASLAFFGHPGYRRLARELPGAMQIPLLQIVPGRQYAPHGLRVPQSGWLDEPRPHGQGDATEAARPHAHGALVEHVARAHRFERRPRTLGPDDEDALLRDRVTHVLFSTAPERLGLYGKPMARNAQVWTEDFALLLDGPRHDRERIDEARRAVALGGRFGYRFLFPPMRVGRRELVWHLPLVLSLGDPPRPVFEPFEAPLGFVAATPVLLRAVEEGPVTPIELRPRLRRRPGHAEAAELFPGEPGQLLHHTSHNARKILEAAELLPPGSRLRRGEARRLLTAPRASTLEDFLDGVRVGAKDPARGEALASALERVIEPASSAPAPRRIDDPPRTFAATANRAFEERWWHTIARLAHGEYRDKENADHCGTPTPAGARDLDRLADHLLDDHRALVARHGMAGRALVGEQRFPWRSECDLPWMGGWAKNQTGELRERNLVVVIPGRATGDRRTAVVLADHYDTAYMEDVLAAVTADAPGGEISDADRARLGRRAAAGADDNHSATATLLLAADVLLPLAREGRLRHDVWLVHLSGEEFPADCLGARHLVSRLVERTASISVAASAAGPARGRVDLSQTEVVGAFVLDMIGHNHDRDRYLFQIAHGEGPGSWSLARAAGRATDRWNDAVPAWNRVPARSLPGPSLRSADPRQVPPTVAHPHMDAELRPGWHARSSLYNTDGQIFSDAGIPVVLLMENYDLHRSGYHDSHDTMENIDLDYGSALAAIAIETVAEAAGVE